MSRESKIELISLGVLMGFAWIILLSFIQVSYHFHNTLFWYLFDLHSPLSNFGDFKAVYTMMAHYNPYHVPGTLAVYFPFSYLLAIPFELMPENISLYLFISLFLLFFYGYCYQHVFTSNKLNSIKNTLIFSFLSFPMLFCLQRANYESILFIFCALFISFYHHKDNKKYISIFMLGMAIAMKLYPAVFLLLYFSDKRYKEFFYTGSLALILTLISYACLKGGFFQNMHGNFMLLKSYNNTFSVHNGGVGFGASLFGGIKELIIANHPNSYIDTNHRLYRMMPFIALLIFGGVCLYIKKIETVFWKKVALLIICAIVLPHVSGDYKLILLFIPLFLYINHQVEHKTDTLYALLFILLLIPKPFHLFQIPYSIDYDPTYVNLAVILDPMIMFIMMCVMIGEGMYKTFKKPIGKKTTLNNATDTVHQITI